MVYSLLTGATGFVGRYLLRNLLESDVPIVALVRDGKVETAQQRVDAILRHWEHEAGRTLPRPVVFAADLCQPQLGLDAQQRRWIRENCDAILHCAASMSFREDRRGEPFRTNVGGTEHVLQLCRDTGIGQFHQVSTAYICGLREGRILESEVDLGQELGNVYEQSKLRAEKLIRQADFLERVTFYRPASVVGDSQTGYITNFHGFYHPLQLAHVVASRVAVGEMNQRFFSTLGLRGDEGKNLVPVDWLTEAITYLVTHPEWHGQTYHLAHSKPVPVSEIQRVVQEAIERYHPHPRRGAMSDEELQSYEVLFRNHMQVYRSHWRDDPKFDLTNTRRALSHLPCPEMDFERLMRIARYPIERDFNVSRYEKFLVDFDVARHLERWMRVGGERPAAASTARSIGLQVNGSGGGQWQLMLDHGRLCGAELGLPGGPAARIYLNASTFKSLVQRQLTVRQSISAGRVVLEGIGGDNATLLPLLEQVVEAA